MIPGHEVVSDPITRLRTTLPDGYPSGTLGDGIAQIGVWIIAALLASSAIFALRAPPERSALFRSRLWMAYDVTYAVALRAVVLFLLVLAWEEFTKMQEGSRPAPIVVVAAVIVLATLEVGVARWLQRPTRRTPTVMRTVSHGLRKRGGDLRAAVPASIAFALPAAGIAVLLAVGLIVIVAPFLAMALFPNTANIVLGTIVVFFAFQVLLAVGKWRWSAWDERERIETQERGFETGSNWAVGTQMTIHMLAEILLYVGIVRRTTRSSRCR